jgi:hypothetical protein
LICGLETIKDRFIDQLFSINERFLGSMYKPFLWFGLLKHLASERYCSYMIS